MNRTRFVDLPTPDETGRPTNRIRLCWPYIAANLNPTFLTSFSSNPG